MIVSRIERQIVIVIGQAASSRRSFPLQIERTRWPIFSPQTVVKFLRSSGDEFHPLWKPHNATSSRMN